jgi:hypothetical protein
MSKSHLTTPLTVFVFSGITFLAGSAHAQVALHFLTAHQGAHPENAAGQVPSQPDAPTVNLWSSLAPCRVTPLPVITDDEALTFEKSTSPDIGGLMAGIRRPDILHDPVHFKLAIGTGRSRA